MKDLVSYLIEGITGKKDFDIEAREEAGRSDYTIVAAKDLMGLIIGKGGRTIKSLRNILKVKATLEKVGVNLSVIEKEAIT